MSNKSVPTPASYPDLKHEQHERARLAELILRRHQHVERRWLERVSPLLKGGSLSTSELRDAMPEYLIRLANSLGGSHTLEAGGSQAWESVAKEHAETRLRQRFDIDQLVREFVVLRHVIFETIADEDGALLDVWQVSTIADLIDGAIEAAVTTYVDARDHEARRKEAEHIGFVTHELRNPLTTAMLGVGQLKKTMNLTEEQAHLFALIQRNQQRMAALVEGVLLVEGEAHAQKPVPVVLTMAELLEGPIATAKFEADAKGLSFTASFDPRVTVYADLKLATSAIENVLKNSVKYTDAGDIRLEAETAQTEIVIHVRDACQGLSAEELRTIFDPFRRGHTRKPGAGLGLSIAKRALEVQGGTIHAESDGRHGCHFWLTLPKPNQ